MQVSAQVIKTIERAIGERSSRLGVALHDLSKSSRGRGTCVLLDHEEFGEALIADKNWRLSLDETQRNSERLAVVDLRELNGFVRVAVLATPQSDGAAAPAECCELAYAALRTVEAVAEITAAYPVDLGVSGPTMGMGMAPLAAAVG
ncbi:hypothetical protein [Ostreiculturibacter nitratireducens]|uniref:hypothetical protein n=1 Tax=Ostreiculturibacter nitratireducens TaxID=3075226 RepID=UPI0031B5D64B